KRAFNRLLSALTLHSNRLCADRSGQAGFESLSYSCRRRDWLSMHSKQRYMRPIRNCRCTATATPVFHFHALATKRADLITQVNAFRAKIAERDLSFREDARKLYDMLIAPVAADLSGKETLVISPESIFWQLPFQALETPSNQPLIEKHAVF